MVSDRETAGGAATDRVKDCPVCLAVCAIPSLLVRAIVGEVDETLEEGMIVTEVRDWVFKCQSWFTEKIQPENRKLTVI